MVNIPYVINQRGERELLSVKKVYRAAKNVGASNQLARDIASRIEAEAIDGMTTSDIYKKVRALLHKETPASAMRFSLKEAMRKMGPAGFYFEKFIGAVYKEAGYSVKINQTIAGKCIKDYEIDFVANKQDALKIGECKYRNQPGNRIDMYVALANHARFLDIQSGVFLNKKEFQGLNAKSVLVTNTKFSGHAIKYSKCMGVELLGWRYPEGDGLERLIDKHQLYPITILPSLNKQTAEKFASKDIMLAKDIINVRANTLSRQLGVPSVQLTKLINQAKTLLGS
ncbi:MAG: hypothetical protein HQ539_03475 [Parcubacteria group bacterium]|nr:hypothetical protein [Parcubacteria group bacterium]